MLDLFNLVQTSSKAVNVGDVFGRLTVLETGQIPDTYRYIAICQCECGSAPKAIRFDSLKSGVVVSCGCFQKEQTTTHGLSKSGHYSRWKNMLGRCEDPSDPAYPDYGARGIKVCDAWHDIEAFVRELPDGYFDGAEIDRIDNDGHYEPGNVQWSTRQENTRNRRSNRNISYLGKSQTLAAWAAEYGMPKARLWHRVVDLGWDIEKALMTPLIDADERMLIARTARWAGHVKPVTKPPRVDRTVEFNGENVTIAKLAELTGIDKKLLRKRIFERGWSVDKATST